MKHSISNKQEALDLINQLTDFPVTIEIKRQRNTRTSLQNKSIHLYCEMLAEALNEVGAEMKVVLEAKSVDVPWNKETVKEVIWRPIQEAMTGIKSTTEISTINPSEIYDVVNRHMAQFGVSVPFPSEESLMYKSVGN